nr:hypothetical protein [Bacilli bacterium]
MSRFYYGIGIMLVIFCAFSFLLSSSWHTIDLVYVVFLAIFALIGLSTASLKSRW